MRNFEERKAEVFRRSENRIKERRRNRNRILAMCIPLCLVLTIFSFTMLPGMLPVGSDDAENESFGNISDGIADTDGAGNPGLVHNFVMVDVRGTGAQSQYHSTIENASGVSGVFEQIYTILIPHESHNDIVGDFADGDTELPDSDGSDELKDATNNTKASSYVITMSTANGMNRTFTLTENKLYDAELNIEVELTNEQVRNLKAALGLTD